MKPTTYRTSRGSRGSAHPIWQHKPDGRPVQVGRVERIKPDTGNKRDHVFKAIIGPHSATGATITGALEALVAVRRRAGIQ